MSSLVRRLEAKQIFSKTLMGFEAVSHDAIRQRALVEEIAERHAMSALKMLAEKWRFTSYAVNERPSIGPNMMGYVLAT